MGMTMTQKTLTAKAGLLQVTAGQLVEASLDLILGNDITSPMATNESEKSGAMGIFHKDKVALVLDRFTPNKDVKVVEQYRQTCSFAGKYDIMNLFDVSQVGIEYALLPGQGLVDPNDCAVDMDSHTCTYDALGALSTGAGSADMTAGMITSKIWSKVPGAIRVVLNGECPKWVSGKDVILYLIGKIGMDGALYQSLRFTGEEVKSLLMNDHLCTVNMTIETDTKSDIFLVNEIILAYCKSRFQHGPVIYTADEDAQYDSEIVIDLSTLRSVIAFPHLPENTRTIDETGTVKIDQVVIGPCIDGRMGDLRATAEILKGHEIDKCVRCIIIPDTQGTYLQIIREGLAEVSAETGAMFPAPTRELCPDGHMGILGKGERAVSTTSRNFVDGMGRIESGVYLSSPAVAAASVTAGVLIDPAVLGAEKKDAEWTHKE